MLVYSAYCTLLLVPHAATSPGSAFQTGCPPASFSCSLPTPCRNTARSRGQCIYSPEGWCHTRRTLAATGSPPWAPRDTKPAFDARPSGWACRSARATLLWRRRMGLAPALTLTVVRAVMPARLRRTSGVAGLPASLLPRSARVDPRRSPSHWQLWQLSECGRRPAGCS